MMKHCIYIFLVLAGIILTVAVNSTISKETDSRNSIVQKPNAKKTIVRPTNANGGRPVEQQETLGQSSEPAVGELIQLQVISMGSVVGGSTNYRLGGTTGQTAIGAGSSTNYGVGQGFWPNLESGCCVGLTGNVDNDPEDVCDIGDLTALIDYLFITFTVPGCLEEANCDGSTNGVVDIGDLTALIDYLFITFTPPAACL